MADISVLAEHAQKLQQTGLNAQIQACHYLLRHALSIDEMEDHAKTYLKVICCEVPDDGLVLICVPSVELQQVGPGVDSTLIWLLVLEVLILLLGCILLYLQNGTRHSGQDQCM